MMPALMPKTIESDWAPLYAKLAAEYLDRLPRGETVDSVSRVWRDRWPHAFWRTRWAFRTPAMRTCSDGRDADRRRRQFRLDAGTVRSERHRQCRDGQMHPRQHRTRAAEPDSSALAFMVNAKNPIPESQMIANIKIAIGGGINEPRDALLTVLYGLLTHPDQLDAVRAGDKWRAAFEEGVRWVAPIQASSRLVMEDTEIRGCFDPEGRHRDDDPGVGQPGRRRLRGWRELQRAARAQSSPGLWQRRRIIARARICRGEPSAPSCCRCCSSASRA